MPDLPTRAAGAVHQSQVHPSRPLDDLTARKGRDMLAAFLNIVRYFERGGATVSMPAAGSEGGVRKRARGVFALSLLLSLIGLLGGVAVARAADPTPLRTIGDPNPDFSGGRVDAVNNELVVGDDQHHQVFVYSRTASGAAAPLRTISGTATGLDFPSSVAVDQVNNQIWAVDNDTADRALVYNRTDNG